MPYELSFAPEFFLAEGEPYDGGPEHGDRPCSVWGAILLALGDPVQRAEIAAVVRCLPQFLTPEEVLEQVQKVNTCSNLDTPVRVWIDSEGWLTLAVWDVPR